MPLEGIQRTPSYYSHERDTQFDEYVARRGSYTGAGNMKADVERAVGTEFGWVSPPTPGGSPKGDAVVMGTVNSRPRGASMPRAPSWASDHVLVAVPEEDDEPDRGQRDREALLGDGNRNSVDQPAVVQEVDVPEPNVRRG